MAGGEEFGGHSRLLSGLFGTLKAAASAHVGTAEVWQALRLRAGEIQRQVQGVTEQISDADLAAQGREVLRGAGVGIRQVNAYRAIAGSWLEARTRLHRLDPDEQITAAAIFQPPWAQTVGSAVPDRYRVRINWEVESSAGDIAEKWSTYDVDGPLSTTSDLLELAEQAARTYVDSDQVFAARSLTPIDWEIEQI